MADQAPNAHHTPNVREGRGDEVRGWWDRTRDTLSSWMGDDDARRRRRWDQLRHAVEETEARGDAPKREQTRNPYGAQGGPTGGG